MTEHTGNDALELADLVLRVKGEWGEATTLKLASALLAAQATLIDLSAENERLRQRIETMKAVHNDMAQRLARYDTTDA